MYSSLIFKEEFKNTLAIEIENILGVQVLDVGKRFESWDSFAFLVTTIAGKKYVGKIFRFPHWPPEGKLIEVTRLLNQYNIPHEKTAYITHNHSVFEFGWQLTEFIDGGTAEEAIENNLTTKENYYIRLGSVLSRVHEIKLDIFGSLQSKDTQHKTFAELVQEELQYQTFDLETKFLHYSSVISAAKEEIIKLIEKQTFSATLVHDDVGTRNVLWNYGDPVLIDWVDSLAGPALRDFATVTLRENSSVIPFLEKGYGKEINKDELRLHQLMRLVRLGRFYYEEGNDCDEFEIMMKRAT